MVRTTCRPTTCVTAHIVYTAVVGTAVMLLNDIAALGYNPASLKNVLWWPSSNQHLQFQEIPEWLPDYNSRSTCFTSRNVSTSKFKTKPFISYVSIPWFANNDMWIRIEILLPCIGATAYYILPEGQITLKFEWDCSAWFRWNFNWGTMQQTSTLDFYWRKFTWI